MYFTYIKVNWQKEIFVYCTIKLTGDKTKKRERIRKCVEGTCKEETRFCAWK